MLLKVITSCLQQVEKKYPGMMERLFPNSPANKKGHDLVPHEEQFFKRSVLVDLEPPQRP